MALVAGLVVGPFMCWGDRLDTPVPADDPCALGVNPIVHNGSALVLLGTLAIVGASMAVAWAATVDRPRLRGIACLAFGLAAAAPLAYFGILLSPAVAIFVVWTMIPAILLIGSAFRLLRRPGA